MLELEITNTEEAPEIQDFFAVFKDESFVRLYGVTEIFVHEGLLHITSNFALHSSYYTSIAEHIRGFGIECQA